MRTVLLPKGRMITLRTACKIGVIADDLTGANDTGVQFSKYGLSTMVVFDVDYIDDTMNEADVIVIETDSRWCDPRTAYGRAKAAAEILKEIGASVIYKKIDSTLRGNIGAELDAVMDVFEAKVAFVVPAFPDMGRITIDGRQLFHDFHFSGGKQSSNLMPPIGESHLPTLLTQQTQYQIGHIDIGTTSSGPNTLLKAFQSRMLAGDQIIVIDASEKAHLRTVADSVASLEASLEASLILVGSAGLAAELPRAFGIIPMASVNVSGKRRHGVLFIGGSANPVTQKQVAFATNSMDLDIITIYPNDIVQGLDNDELGTVSIIRQVCSSLAKGRDVLLSLARPTKGKPCYNGHNENLWSIKDSRRIASYLGVLAYRILSTCGTAGLILTGGDTARAVSKSLGGVGVIPFDEISPGIPLVDLVGGAHDGLTIVTKAGGFGERDAIVKAIQRLHKDGIPR